VLIYLSSLILQLQQTQTHYSELLKEDNLQAEARKLALDTDNKDLIKLLETYNPKWQNAGQSFGESLLNGLNSMKSSIQQEVNNILSMVQTAQDAQNRIIAQAQSVWNEARKVGDTSAMASAHQIAVTARANGGTLGADNPINQFAVGTNYVPEDQIALIHEGEAIIPKAYNPSAGAKSSAITIHINNPTILNDRDADRLGELLIRRLNSLGVTV
jgi:hypothetical protein